MIYETLEILKDQASQFLAAKFSENDIVVLENISKVEDNTVTTMDDKVVMTLLTMEEEAALKNIPNTQFKNGQTQYKNTAVHLHLFVLFTANRDTYQKSLSALSTVLAFFQHKKIFTHKNTVLNTTIGALNELKSFRIVVELYSQSFEQHNQIWGSLGGKSFPSALYKVSIAAVEYHAIQQVGAPITQVSGNLNHI
ncbi:MAG: hypothetical protein CMC13_12845 [Flavobacteriaceae bacterium]|nr:hypothetical protein [Flavobacteriaceae bacterium]|tara:strand:- start:575 stop:1162 length:588 start_codon:yes stop_codon:yes gene_type:complete